MSISNTPPWVELSEVCQDYGVRFETALNKIAAGTFPVKTYKVGKKVVIDREVHVEYFLRQRKIGMKALGEK